MTQMEVTLPKMGESISQATLLHWTKQVGDRIEIDETLVEVATDKVDTEIPSPCTGVITEIYCQPNEVITVGQLMAVITPSATQTTTGIGASMAKKTTTMPHTTVVSTTSPSSSKNIAVDVSKKRADFLSPLVIKMAQKEHITMEELQRIKGTGINGRVRKSDVTNYLQQRRYPIASNPSTKDTLQYTPPSISYTAGKDQRIPMDRMRSSIAAHMVYSKRTAPHVTTYIEVDVTNLVHWRTAHKQAFLDKYDEKLTYTPVFIEAVTDAIAKFPMINAALDGDEIVVHKDIHIGMATALPTGNLIVPVVRDAANKSLPLLAETVNRLAHHARTNSLQPADIGGSTFTISNVGTFGSLMGTPIINQPEVAILALGMIKKRPEVITIAGEEQIAIRSMMYLSLSFDHRVIDGWLGGSFLRAVGDALENFDPDRTY